MLVLIACGKEKAAERRPAVDLYSGPLYRARLALARALYHADPLILSALHGVVDPWEPLEPYDVEIGDLTRAAAATWGGEVCAEVQRRAEPGELVVVFAGADYLKPWGAVCSSSGRLVVQPMAGLGMGEQRAALAAALAGLEAGRKMQRALMESTARRGEQTSLHLERGAVERTGRLFE
jgi:hypothetical protein